MEEIGTIVVHRSDVGANKVDRLLTDFAELKLTEANGCTLESLQRMRNSTMSKDYSDDRVYKVFASCFMERRMWKEALCDLHCRLYLLDKDCSEYESTMDMLHEAQKGLLSEIMPIPVAFKEMLFLRDLEESWSKWTSRMAYTDRLQNISNAEDSTLYRSNTVVTRVPLRPGSLLMRARPFSVAPWTMDPPNLVSSDGKRRKPANCFHCLSAMNSLPDPYYERTTFVSCPTKPYECSRVFCSEECFLNNGAVHAVECGYLVKLKAFAATALNEALVLLVARTFIRCGMFRDKKEPSTVSLDKNEHRELNSKDDIIQRILRVNVDYTILEAKHRQVLEEIQTFAYFLAAEFGFEFCFYLKHREIVHFIVVLWTKSLPLAPEVHTCFDNHKLGGVAFNIDLMGLQQSLTPTLTVHFDSKGRIALRSMYAMEAGTRLYINTLMDKYLPLYRQEQEFWSVSMLLCRAVSEVKVDCDNTSTLCALRCNVCIRSFCHATGVKESDEPPTDETPTTYSWECETCKSGNQDDLNLLQRQAEDIIRRAHRLYDAGQHLVAKRMLDSFVRKWPGILHCNHYLLYNAQVLLAGIQMNGAGSNIQMALNHLIAATLMAEEIFPRVCQEKAHLYSRLADLMGQVVLTTRMTRKDDVQLKQMTMEAAYTALWNWTIIAGCESHEALLHMQKCRSLAFQMNIHVPSLSHNFVINIPAKYLEVFKLVTGTCVIPSILKFSTGNIKDVPTDNVATVAFMAAQNGILTDSVLDVLMTVESSGIMHLGTGLSILGISASNGNVELVKAITEAIEAKVTKAFELLGKNDDIGDLETTVVNLLLALVGGNELGITPLMAMASVPPDVDKSSLKNEIIIARLIIECVEKCDDVIKKFKGNEEVKFSSLKWFMSSGFTLKGLLVDARTHHFLKGQTIVHYPASKGKKNLVKYLARVIGNVNQMNLEGATPLHLAALGGHVEVCETLISFGADQTVSLVTGELPMHLAIHSLHEQTVKLLLDHYTKRAVDKNVDAVDVSIAMTKRRGPSIWHALIAGIYDTKGVTDENERGRLKLETIVSRLTKAVRIAQLLAENAGAQETYVWADATPSQILQRKWQEYMEQNSLDFDPRENFQKLRLQNVNTVLHNKVMVPQSNKPSEIINDRTDAVFAATRAVQFLSQLLQRAEETAVEAANAKVSQHSTATTNT